MTIQAAKLAGKMATKTTEPLTVATSESCDSELEEGEIANDEIEIIEEVIRHPVPPPISNVKPPMQQHVIRPSTTVKRSPPPSRKFDSSLDTLSLKRSRVDGAGNISVTLFNVNVTRKHDAETKSTTKRRSTAAGRSPTRNQSRKVLPPNPIKPFNNGMQQLKDSSSNGHAERAKRPPTTREPALRPSKSESSIQSSVVNHGKPEPAKDKWVSTFESTTCCSVESMDIDSSSEDDEELGLRLAALHSVVSNSNKPKEPKEPHSDSGPSSKSPPPQPVTENPNAEETQEEDEDEELLRAQLLIEVALKQTKDLEKKVPQPSEPTEKKVTEVDSAKVPPLPALRPTAAMKNSVQLPVIPKADRLVINLQEDSSDSSDAEEDSVVNSITALLKSARQTVEKTEQRDAASTVQDVSALPRNKQEEYQRLKQELIRRQNIRLQQQQNSSSIRTAMLTQSQTDNIPKTQSPTPASSSTDRLPVQQSSPSQLPTPAPTSVTLSASSKVPSKKMSSIQPVPLVQAPAMSSSSAKENHRAKEDHSNSPGTSTPTTSSAALRNDTTLPPPKAAVAPSSKPTDSVSVARMTAIKEQLVRKKQDLATTKEALKTQLELVDRNRALWMKSSQEVGRLKALLQAAEDTERQLLSQLTSSQEQTQRMKTKMQTVEKQIDVLRRGLNSPRSRRSSVKLRSPKSGPQAVKHAASTASLPGLSSVSLRIKPKVFVRALAKTNHLTYVQPVTTPAPSIAGVKLPHEKVAAVVAEKKTVHYDEPWLYGTLGDDLDGSTAGSLFPAWSSNEHASQFVKSKLSLDPLRAVCCHHLESASCRDADQCSFQHLPIIETPPPVASSVPESSKSGSPMDESSPM